MPAATASAKLKIEGLAELKSAMNQAKSAIKAIDAEMAAAAATYKETGDQEAYIATQSSLLNEKLTAQKTILAAAEQAMSKMEQAGEKGSSAYNAMRTAAANAQASISDLNGKLSALASSTDGASDNVDEVETSVDDLGSTADESAGQVGGLRGALDGIAQQVSLDSVIKGIDSIRDTAVRAAKSVLDIGAGLWKTSADAASWADDLATSARDAGNVDIEDFQRWQYASEILDVSVDSIVKAQDKLSKAAESKGTEDGFVNILDFLSDEARASVALSEDIAKVSRFNEDGSMKSANQLLWDTVDAISKMEEETQREIVAQQIFGRSYRDVYGLFQEGAAENFVKAMQEVTPLTEEQIAAMLDYKDSLDLMSSSWENSKMTLFAALAPSFQTIAESFTEIAQKIQEWANTPEGAAAIEKFGDSISTIITNFTNGDLSAALDHATQWINGLTDKFSELKDIDLGAWATGVGVALGTLTAAEGFLKVMKMIEGFKTVFGSGATSKLTAEVTQTTSLDTATSSAIGSILGKVSSILPYVAGIAVVVAGMWPQQAANDEEIIALTKAQGGDSHTQYEAARNWEGFLVFAHDYYRSTEDAISDLSDDIRQAYKISDEASYDVYEAFTQYANKGLAPKEDVTAIMENGYGEQIRVTLDKYGQLAVEEIRTGMEVQEQARQEWQQTQANQAAFNEAFSDVARAYVESFYDKYRAGDTSALSDLNTLKAMFRDMPDVWEALNEQVLSGYKEAAANGQEDLLPEDFFSALNKDWYTQFVTFGKDMPEDVAEGINSAIPEVSASVAALNAVISQIGAVSVGGGGNTTNNTTTTYIENYNTTTSPNFVDTGSPAAYGVG